MGRNGTNVVKDRKESRGKAPSKIYAVLLQPHSFCLFTHAVNYLSLMFHLSCSCDASVFVRKGVKDT